MSASSHHRRWMERCLELAQMAAGRTAPNPMVGCVILNDGLVVGEGFHPGAGQPHAEVFALRQAQDRAQGATLYVSLEPCNHHGRTPPCTEAVIGAGIAKVVVGMIDPNPQVAGAGVARLRAAGIEVEVGIEEAACQRLNRGFIHRVTQGRPLGILKYAMTLDGKIATPTGHSAWVTSPAARAAVHQLRATCDAVIVGGETVRQDNPHLTTHGHSTHNPRRVILSRQLDLPTTARVWDSSVAPTVVYCQGTAPADRQHFLQDLGVTVVPLPELTPAAVMADLHRLGCLTALWECGGTLAAAAIRDQAVQRVWAFVAPKIIGGRQAPSPVGDLQRDRMDQALPLQDCHWRQIGPDLLIEGTLIYDEDAQDEEPPFAPA